MTTELCLTAVIGIKVNKNPKDEPTLFPPKYHLSPNANSTNQPQFDTRQYQIHSIRLTNIRMFRSIARNTASKRVLTGGTGNRIAVWQARGMASDKPIDRAAQKAGEAKNTSPEVSMTPVFVI